MKILKHLLGLFWWPFFPGIGGGSKSNSSTTTDSSTKVTTTNQQTGASEGSFAVGGSGNSVNYTTEDPKTLQHIADVNQNVTTAALTSGNKSTEDALNFGSDALDTVGRTVQQANDLLSRSFESYAGKLQDNSGSAPSTVAISTNKNQTYIIIASVIAVVVGAVFIFKLAKEK